MSIKAYSYIRFSSAPQEFGDSIRRQTEKRDDFIKNCGLDLELDTTLDMTDKGLSAFDGSNVEKGALGAFIKAVEIGKVKRGSYLLVENLDRLSRESLEKSMFLLLGILEHGIYLVTLSDKKIINPGKKELTDILPIMIELERAYKESERKSELIKAAWNNKREMIHEKKLTKWSPKWLTLSDDRTEYLVNEERAEIVKRIFEWSVSGLGTHLIIKRLEENGVKPWDMGEIKRKKRLAKQWHSGIIQRFLTDRTVLGEYKLRKENPEDGHEVIEDYFPRIIEDELFYRAQEARSSRSVYKKGGGRKGVALSNLFSKLARCGYSLDENKGGYRCAGSDAPMVYINKGKNNPNKYLQCGRIKNGNTGCDNGRKMWVYATFEKSFLTHIKDIDASMLIGKSDNSRDHITDIERNLTTEEGRLRNIENQINSIKDGMKNHNPLPDFMIEEGHAREKEKKHCLKSIEELRSEVKSAEYDYNNSDKEIEKLSELIGVMEGVEGQELFDLRLQLSELLKKFIDRIEVYSKGHIESKEVREKMAEELRERFEEDEVQRYFKESDKSVLPFYVVRYKSGERRMVHPNPNDPTKIITNVKFDSNGVVADTDCKKSEH